MHKIYKEIKDVRKIFFLFAIFMMGWAAAQSAEEFPTSSSEPYNPVPEIMHHIADSHSWHLWGSEKEGNDFTIPLPVILVDNGLKVFMSSKFKSLGEDSHDKIAEVGGNHYVLHESKIYKTDANGTIETDGELVTNEAPLDFSLTQVSTQILFATFLLIWLAFSMKRKYKKSEVPSGIARFVEPLIIFVRDEIAREAIGPVHYKRFVPYLVSLFFFIWLLNVLGIIPGAANVTGNIAVTFILSVFTLLLTFIVSRKTYWKHIVDPLGKNMPIGGKIPVYMILVPVEFLGIFTKPFALMIRLFANMTAGHIVVLSLIALIFIVESYAVAPVSLALTLFIDVLEILVTALQAYIFTLLTALYIGMAVEDAHE